MDSQDHRLVNVDVELERDFPVDTISVTINLEGTHKTREACTNEYNQLLAEVLAALAGAGIPADEVKNSDYHISAHTEELYVKDEDGDYYQATNKLVGYDYSASMSLTRPFADSDDAKAIWVASPFSTEVRARSTTRWLVVTITRAASSWLWAIHRRNRADKGAHCNRGVLRRYAFSTLAICRSNRAI